MAHLILFVFNIFVLLSLSKKRTSPNIVFILMDDIGWNDVSFNGGQFPTPNIDQLKSNGVSLNTHYIHLMCSPSRSQIITGRYAMYSGYGKMLPWDYTEIGGIPRGQPTIASWLQSIGGYNTFAVGKWHLGYSSDLLIPTSRGFDHFYGFYQGAIHYDNLKYIDIKYGDSNHFDFWEDAKEQILLTNDIADRQQQLLEWQEESDVRDYIGPDYSGKSIFDDNTMYLYRDKIIQYIDQQIYNSKKTKVKKQKNMTPFFMYIALQTIHGPLNEVPEKMNECNKILPDDATNRRHKYCENMLLTDDVIGDIIDKLKEMKEVWDNTVIVFTSDNGGDVSNKGCNFPLRGTKGTLFDGNLRTIALVSGGLIPEEQYGTTRDEMFSSLDWTPTLLKYANLLNKINKKDFTWDGVNQYDLIMYGSAAVSEEKKRDHIVMNVGLKNLDSASIVFEYPVDNKLYKYISKSDAIDRWAYIRDDGWCVPDQYGNFNLILDDDVSLAQAVDNRFLFCLTDDIAEKTNLLQLDGDAQTNYQIIEYAKHILKGYTEHYLYSEPLTFLWNRLPAGNPSLLGDGAFVAPFLNEQQYTWHLRKGFNNINDQYTGAAIEQGVDVSEMVPYSKALQGLFFKSWEPPVDTVDTVDDENDEEYVLLTYALPLMSNGDTVKVRVGCLFIAVCVGILCVGILYVVYKRYYQYNYSKDGYQVIAGNDDTRITMQ